MKAIGRGGGEGWDKEEGEGEGRREAHPLFFIGFLSLHLLAVQSFVYLWYELKLS
jgi:hypothetical protein